MENRRQALRVDGLIRCKKKAKNAGGPRVSREGPPAYNLAMSDPDEPSQEKPPVPGSELGNLTFSTVTKALILMAILFAIAWFLPA